CGSAAAALAARLAILSRFWNSTGSAILRDQTGESGHKRRGARVIHGDELCDYRLSRLLCRDVLVAVDGNDSGERVFRCCETLPLENRAERDVPRLVLDLCGDRSLHILSNDNGASGERGESGDYVANVSVLICNRDPRLLGNHRRRKESAESAACG